MPNTTTPFTRYRMPVGFGPAPGPRQKADGTEWTADETGTMRQEFLTISFLGRAGQLERLLPPGFSLRGEPVVSVQLGFFRDLYWLAGRGYGILHPLIPVTYTGKTETIEGNFMPVLWEGLADAVITGRDELGFPKLAADIPDFWVDLASRRVSGTASWLGFEFFSAELTGLAEVRDARPPAADPMLTFKYVPHTSPHGAGGADIAHVTTGAAAANGSRPEPGARLPPLGRRGQVHVEPGEVRAAADDLPRHQRPGGPRCRGVPRCRVLPGNAPGARDIGRHATVSRTSR